jgi:hypothetical protein
MSQRHHVFSARSSRIRTRCGRHFVGRCQDMRRTSRGGSYMSLYGTIGVGSLVFGVENIVILVATAMNSHLIAGCLMIGRYNDKNGLIDCHVLPLPVKCIDPLGDSSYLDRRRVSLFERTNCISVPFQSNNPTPTRPRILPPESQANTSRLRKRPRRPNDETRSCDSPKQEKRTR